MENDEESLDGRTSKMSSIGRTTSMGDRDTFSRMSTADQQLKLAHFVKPSLLVKRPNRLRKRRTKAKKHVVSNIAEEEEVLIIKFDEEHCIRFLCEHEDVRNLTIYN